MKEEFSAGGIVYRLKNNTYQILFILDPYKKWATPKGHIEPGENAEKAALREISEETGVNSEELELKDKLGTMDYIFDFKGNKIHKTVTFFLVKMDANVEVHVPENEKITDHKWVNISEALDFAGYENLKDFVSKGISIINNEKL